MKLTKATRSFLAATLCAISTAAIAADHDHHKHGEVDIVVSDAWTRPVANVGGVGVGYGIIANSANTTDELLGAVSDAAERVELHETTIDDAGVASMKKIDRMAIDAGQQVELKPGGKHIMFIGLKAAVKDGTGIKATLRFKNAGDIDVEFKARSTDAPAELELHEHHHH